MRSIMLHVLWVRGWRESIPYEKQLVVKVRPIQGGCALNMPIAKIETFEGIAIWANLPRALLTIEYETDSARDPRMSLKCAVDIAAALKHVRRSRVKIGVVSPSALPQFYSFQIYIVPQPEWRSQTSASVNEPITTVKNKEKE